MLNKLEKLFASLLCAALLAGCQSTGQVQAVQAQAMAINSQNPVLQLAAAAPFTLVRLKEGNQLGLSAVMTGPRYRSASGRICKSLLNRLRLPVGQLVCNKGKNSWYVQRALSLTSREDFSNSESIVAAADIHPALPVNYTTAISVESNRNSQVLAHDQTSIEITPADSSLLVSLEENETLWSFALRVTGDGQNWRAIAEDNGIDDATKINKDIQLKVANRLIQL